VNHHQGETDRGVDTAIRQAGKNLMQKGFHRLSVLFFSSRGKSGEWFRRS
jgi:hypothetical protein